MCERANLKTWLVISVLLVMMGSPAIAAGATIYVDATKNGDGSSWANAYKYLQDALSAAASGDEIRVAEGIYIPDRCLANHDGSGDRAATFYLKTGVGIYGGFPVGGGVWDAREPNAYQTVLSGDLNGDGVDFTNTSDNSYHVVTAFGTDATAILDGFIITAGNADGGGMDDYGGGMSNYHSNPTVTRCTFLRNFANVKGGGMSNKYCSLEVENSMFIDNLAGVAGGGLFNEHSSPTLINCVFTRNSAEYYGGGVHNCSASNDMLINCTFTGNSSGSYGGGISNDSSSTTVTNCILWGNTAPIGPQISLQSGSALSVSYSCLQGSLPATHNTGSGSITWGPGNIADNPQLAADGYHLDSGSPCIDAGDPNGDYSEQTDIDGQPRVMGQYVDMGCDEVAFISVYYVDDDAPSDPGPGDPDISDPLENGSETHPFDSIQEAIDATRGVIPIIVLDGTYTGTGNYDIDFYGKVVTLSSQNGAANCIIDCSGLGRGFDFHSAETQETIVAGFTITNGQADYGGAIRCINSSPQIRNCVITDNIATNQGGGLYCYYSRPMLVDCTFSNNSPDGIWTEGDGAWLVGTVQIISDSLAGEGTLHMELGTILNAKDCLILCNLFGPGTIQVDIGFTLTIGGSAVIDFGNPDYHDAATGDIIYDSLLGDAPIDLGNPDETNAIGIICDGSLVTKGNAQILNGNINITIASFEDNTNISNSVITIDPKAPYGQVFFDPNVSITDNVFYADGDRYMNLDPEFFSGPFQNNLIYVTITKGVGQEEGQLFELRGKDGLVSHSCEPNEFLCQVAPGTIPECNLTTWTLERLELIKGAKLNLTNRFGFQPPYDFGTEDEVLYVKELILRENSVFNTGYNRVYYESLIVEPNAVIRHEPLLGYSLINIAFDDEIEFIIRVMHNNFEDPLDPNNNRIYIERVDGNAPDPNGMMLMRNLLVQQNIGQVVNARAKGLFAQSNEDEYLIWFEYLFGTSGPGVEMAELVISLSNVPEFVERNDPNRIDHYVEVARLHLPPVGQHGSVGAEHFGIFEEIVPTGGLDFIRGVRMELELVGPEGTWILINNWDPSVSCVYCGDVTGDLLVSPRDYLTIVGESGEVSSGTSLHCLDFGVDGFVGTTDMAGWDWGEWLASEKGVGNLCFKICLTECDSAPNTPFMLDTISASSEPQSGGSTGFAGSLLIAGKMFDFVDQNFLSDRLYDFDENYNLVGGPYMIPYSRDRLNGRLVRDHNDLLYQINMEEGLIRFPDFSSVIPRGYGYPIAQGYPVSSDPRYGLPATVYVGFQNQRENTWGRPFFDAAFDSEGNVYVTPVVIAPSGGDPYVASAKLVLVPGQTPPYNVVKIYDDEPPPHSNQDRNNLREIEVDDNGNVYVINKGYANNSDILWVYHSNGDVNKCEVQSLGIYGPIGLHCSSYDNSRLYLASSMSEPNAASASLHVLSTADLTHVKSITINKMGHITDITEDPFTGTLWVVGYTMPKYIDVLPVPVKQFYFPYLADVPYDSSGPILATDLTGISDLGMPLSIAWVGDMPATCGGADLDGTGNVNFGDFTILASQWLQAPGTPSADIAPEAAGDGVVNFLDLAVLADHWLDTWCD